MKFLKNRLVIGCICVIFAFLIGFIAVPKMTDKLNDKITIVVASSEIKKGDMLSSSNLKVIQVSKGDIPYSPNEYYNNVSQSNGQTVDNRRLLTDNDNRPRNVYAAVDMQANDVVTDMKISEKFPYTDEKLRELRPNEYAVSVSVRSLATGISANIYEGDIVTVIAVTDDKTFADMRLLYMEVLSVSNSDGIEINSANKEKGIPAVVTFRANLYQAETLAYYESNAYIHLALVCRGDDKKAQELLALQEKYLSDNNMLFNDQWFYMDPQGGVSNQ